MENKKYYNKDNIQYILHFPGIDKFGEDICNREVNRKIKVSDRITLVSPMNKAYVENSYLKKQCDNNNIKLLISDLAYNTVEWNHINKIQMIYDSLIEVKTEYTIVLDGADTIIVNDLDDEFIEKCLSYGSDILYNADILKFPKNEYEVISKDATQYHTKFMNSGICFGKTSSLITMFQEILPIVKWNLKNKGGDQALIKQYRYCIDEHAFEADYMCKVFTLLHTTNPSHTAVYEEKDDIVNIYEYPTRRTYYNIDSIPINILHFPGDGMEKYGNKIAKFEENRNFTISKDLSIISIMTADFWEDSPVRKQCDYNGVHIYNTGYDVKPEEWSNTMKIELILEALEQIETEYVIICDGRDVAIVNDLDDKFLDKVKRQKYPVMYNSTIFRFPDVAVENVFDILSQPGEFKHFNAGVCVGTVKQLKYFYNLCKKYNKQIKNNFSEQLVLRTARAMGDNYKTIGIDSLSQLFRTVHSRDNDIYYSLDKSKFLLCMRNIEDNTKAAGLKVAPTLLGSEYIREFCDEKGIWRTYKYVPEKDPEKFKTKI